MQRTLLALALFLPAACLSSPGFQRDLRAESSPALDRVALEVHELPLEEVVGLLVNQAGVPVHVDPRLSGLVTLRHDGVPLDFSLRWVAEQVGARVAREGGEFHLRPLDPTTDFVGGRRCGEVVGER